MRKVRPREIETWGDLQAIVRTFHDKLRKENLSLRIEHLLSDLRYGPRDTYHPGERDGKIQAYSEILCALDPYYDLTTDEPVECFNPDCDHWLFKKGSQKYHDVQCRERHYEKMRSEKTGIFSKPDRTGKKRRKREVFRLDLSAGDRIMILEHDSALVCPYVGLSGAVQEEPGQDSARYEAAEHKGDSLAALFDGSYRILLDGRQRFMRFQEHELRKL